ncbi:MAG: type II secretion system protein [Ruminococcus sp.]|nr:type II secretion system protein [Ruminococcus sp.]
MDNKRKAKGFTLIELMIVLAIFGIILSLVMSFIDPVAKVMKTTSTRERTAAYVDNIGEYIDNSLHYAKFMRVYNGDFCDSTYMAPLDSDLMKAEMAAVQKMVDESLDQAVDSSGNPIEGRARVLKLINSTPDRVKNTGCNEVGQIYESVYKFTVGDHVYKRVTDAEGNETLELIEDKSTDSTISTVYTNQPVVNDEHLNEYCYYYVKGYYTLDAITDPENYTDTYDATRSFASSPREYYSRLNPITDMALPGSDKTLCINVVSYLRDKAKSINNIEKNVKYQKDESTIEDAILFKSPAYLSSASMTLLNLGQGSYTKLARDVNHNKKSPIEFAPITGALYSPKMEYIPGYDETKGNTDNIYIVYIMPDEIYDAQISYD